MRRDFNGKPRNKEPSNRKFQRLQVGTLFASVSLYVFLSACYYWRWEGCAAVTFFPPWVWLIPGFFLTGLGYRKTFKWYVLTCFLLGIIFLFSSAEEPRSLIRSRSCSNNEWTAARQQGKALRIVSLNCAGKRAAAREAFAENPDIILLQESPDRETLKTLAQQVFKENADCLWGIDTSILARGRIFPEKGARFFTRARVQLSSGRELQVISLRLLPPIVRLDLWSPSGWRDQTQNRRYHREQLQELAQIIKTIPPTVPLIIGGDFNAPGGDGAMASLHPRLHDTFQHAGIGWGNTGINEFPVSRIDQIWTTDHFRPIGVIAKKTEHSDHRMVICDLFFNSFLPLLHF